MSLEVIRARSSKAITLFIVGGIALLIVGGTSGFLLWKWHGRSSVDTSAQTIQAVGKLYLLPTGEEPTVAKIRDRSKLDGQAFFDAAQNGDMLLVYKQAKLALIYRPGLDKLVNVGPVTPQSQNGQSSDETASTPDDAAAQD